MAVAERPTPLDLRVTTANYAARRIREEMRLRRLRASLGLTGEEQPPAGWGIPHGRRLGGQPSARFVPPPSTYVRPLATSWLTGVYPASMTTRKESTWIEL